MTPTQAQIMVWRDVVTQAMACIRGEAPEDISFGEAEDDTFSKLRQVDAEMSAALTAAAEVGDMGNYDSDTIKNWKWHCLSCGTLTNDGECDCTKWPEYANRQRLLRLHP